MENLKVINKQPIIITIAYNTVNVTFHEQLSFSSLRKRDTEKVFHVVGSAKCNKLSSDRLRIIYKVSFLYIGISFHCVKCLPM